MPDTATKVRVNLAAPRSSRRRQLVTFVAFLAPAFVVLFVLRILPIADAFRLSFTDWNGLSVPQFVGLSNFQELVKDKVFLTALSNNAKLAAFIPLWVLLPLGVALLLHQRVPGHSFYRTVFFLPSITSAVIIGLFFKLLLSFDGPVNDALRLAGLSGAARGWLADPATAFLAVIAIVIWATFGIGVVVFSAALSAVDDSLEEAAVLDGATRTQIARHVMIPAIRPTIEFWTITVLIVSFTSVFALVYTLTAGGPGYLTRVVEYDMYTRAFVDGRFGYASAIGVVLFLLIAVLGGGLTVWFGRREAH